MIIENKYCVIDVETGGLKYEKNPMTEVGLIILDKNLNELTRYESLIQPYGVGAEGSQIYEPMALKMTGISMEMINGGKPAPQVAQELHDLFKSHSHGVSKKLVLVGHNMQFDYGFISELFRVHKLDLSKVTDPTFQCTLWHSRNRWGHDDSMTDFKLPTCASRAGVELGDAHRALADVEATVGLFKYHMTAIRSGGATTQVESAEFRRKHSFRF